MNATGARDVWGSVTKGVVAGIATALGVVALSLPAFGVVGQSGGVTNSGDANAGSGANTAVGNQSTNTATTGSVVGTVGALVQPIINLGAPQNDSTGTAAITTGPAVAAGNNASGSVDQTNGAGSGAALQSGNVTNSGSAVATSGGNVATGNQSTNTASVDQSLTGSLVGVALNIGGPSNQSSGTATIDTGLATALGNTADGSVVQGHGGAGECGRTATLQDAAVTNTGTALADTGGNHAVGNASTNTAAVVQNVNGGLLGLGLALLGPTNNSTGSAVINTGPATALGNQSTGNVIQESCDRFRSESTILGVDTAPGPTGPALARTGGDPLSLGATAILLLVLGLLILRVAPTPRGK